MPRKTGTQKKNQSWSLKSKGKNAGAGKASAQPVAAPVNLTWETNLLEVRGNAVSLSHPRLEAGTATMKSYLSPDIITLPEGIKIKPGRDSTQVTAYYNEKSNTEGMIFTAFGGEIEFAPPNLNGISVLGDLAVTTIVADGMQKLPIAPTFVEESAESEIQPAEGANQLPIAPTFVEPSAESEIQSAQGTNQLPIAPTFVEPQEVAPAAVSETEISFSIEKPLVIQPMEGFQMELGNGHYTKDKGDSEPKMIFHNTKLFYRNKPVAWDFATESDKTGLHFAEGRTAIPLNVEYDILDGDETMIEMDLLLDSSGASIRKITSADLTENVNQEKEQAEEEQAEEELAEEELAEEEQAEEELAEEELAEEELAEEELVEQELVETGLVEEELVQEEWIGVKVPEVKVEAPPQLESEQGRTITIRGVTFYLWGIKDKDDGRVVAAKAVSQFAGYSLTLKGVLADFNKQKLVGKVVSISPPTASGVSIQCDKKLTCDEEHGMRTKSVTLQRNEMEYALKNVTLKEDGQIFAKTVHAEIGGYQSALHNALFQSFDKIDHESADVQSVLLFGLNRGDENATYDGKAQSLFSFRLGKGTVLNDQFGTGTKALKLASQLKYTEIEVNAKKETPKNGMGDNSKEKTPTTPGEQTQSHNIRKGKQIEKKDIFTDDGFVQLEDAVFDFGNDGKEAASVNGTGGFRFLSIPYDITIPGKTEPTHLKDQTQEKSNPEDRMNFTVGPDGKIHAKFKNPVVLSMMKPGIESGSIIYTLTLRDASIENSVLKAKNVRIDRGLEMKKDSDADDELSIAEKLFGVGFRATVADVGGSMKVSSEEGITGETNSKQPGEFGVSNFLGFLDVSGDYEAGQLHAALKKEKDTKDKDTTSKFSQIFEDARNELNMSLNIGGPLAFSISLKPSLKIGAELSADLDRKKSFGAQTEANDPPMELGGKLDLDGAASITLSTGLSVGLSFIRDIASAGINLNASVGSTIEAALKGNTKLKIEDGEMKQAEKLTAEGLINVGWNTKLSLTGDIKVLIWKANIFEIKLAEKQSNLVKIKASVWREPGSKDSPMKGWHFDSAEFSAEAFGNKAFRQIQGAVPEAKGKPIVISEEALKHFSDEAKDAWAMLEDLKQKQSLSPERAYVIEEKDKQALEAQIQNMTQTAREKLEKYMEALVTHKADLEQKMVEAYDAVQTARDEKFKYEAKDEVRDKTLKETQIGGFNLDNYRELDIPDETSKSPGEQTEGDQNQTGKKSWRQKFKDVSTLNSQKKQIEKENERRRGMAAADFAIARMLGIYDSAMTQARGNYDNFAKLQNLKAGKELYKMNETMTDEQFLSTDHKHRSWNTGLDEVKRLTNFGNEYNYFDVLNNNAISGEVTEDNREGFGIYKKAFRKYDENGNPALFNMRGYDLLKIILTDKFPQGACASNGQDRSGKDIGGTPEEKKKALNHLFFREYVKGGAFSESETRPQEDTQLGQMLSDNNKVYETLFGTTMQKMVRKGDVSIGKKLKELDRKLAEAEANYKSAIVNYEDAQAAVVDAETELANCQQKLAELSSNVAQGVMLKDNAVAGATKAVDFVAQEYQKIASGKTMVAAVAEHEEAKKKLLNAKL